MDDTKEINITVKLTVPQDIDIDDLVSNMDYNFSYAINDEDVIIDTEITNVVEWE